MMRFGVSLVTLLAAMSAGAAGELPSATGPSPDSALEQQIAVEQPSAVEGPPAAIAEDVEIPEARESVARSAFTTRIVDREPADDLTRLSTAHDRVYFFTEILGSAGDTVVHRWEFAGEVRAEVPFRIGGKRWRVYSSKALLPGWIGTWTVTVTDAGGRELVRRQFEYISDDTPAAPVQ